MALVPCETHAALSHEWITPWQKNGEKQRQAWGWVTACSHRKAPMRTAFRTAESSWRVLVAYSRATWSPLGSDFITGGGTPYQWVLAASPSCSCRLASISANLLCQAKRQWGRCSCKDRNEPKQSSQPQLSAQTAPVSARSHSDLFFASDSHFQLIPSLAPLGREPQNHHHGMGVLEGTEKSLSNSPLPPRSRQRPGGVH